MIYNYKRNVFLVILSLTKGNQISDGNQMNCVIIDINFIDIQIHM